MNPKLILCLSFQVLSFCAFCQYEASRQTFFKYIKNFQFDEADIVLAEFEDESWKQAHELLKDLLYESGQLGESKLRRDSIAIRDISQVFSENTAGKLVVNLLWGYYYFYQQPYTSLPIERFSEAYRLSKKIGTSEEVKFCVYSILRLYNWELSQSNDDISDYLEKSKELVEDDVDEFHYRMNKFQYELRDIHFEFEIGDLFIKTFEDLMNSFDANHHFWIEYYITLGVYKRHEGTVTRDFKLMEEASQLFHRALSKMGEEPYLRYLKFRVYMQLSELARAHEDYSKALHYISRAKQSGYLNDPIRSEFWINRYAAPNLFGLGKRDSAFYTLSRADTLKIKLGAQINSLRISQYQWKFQTQEKEEALEQTTNLLVIVIVLLVFVTVVYFLLQMISRKRRLLAIQDKNIQSERVTNLLKEQELIALNSMIEGQEKERRRIAEDLHDRLGSTLSAVKMHMEVLSENDARYEKINTIVNKAVNDTREIAHNMLSGVLTRFGLMAALHDLKETIESGNQFQLKLRSIQFDERLDSETEIQIYRIIQELISNTLKHAKAFEVQLELKRTENQGLVITYQDNGIGFDTALTEHGMGLKNIKNRIEIIQGNWRINSSPGNGVKVIIELWKID